MPLQSSDFPALRAKHLELLQQKITHYGYLRTLSRFFATPVLMVGLLALVLISLYASYIQSSIVVFLMVVIATGVPLVACVIFDLDLALKQHKAAAAFATSLAAGFDKLPDFSEVIREEDTGNIKINERMRWRDAIGFYLVATVIYGLFLSIAFTNVLKVGL